MKFTIKNHAEHEYLRIMQDILKSGIVKKDRTGTGVLSTFGQTIKHDFKHGFPLLTSKKVFYRGAIIELLWFIKGSTNIKYLKENNVNFWDNWADENGNLGPIYGYQLRTIEKNILVKPKIFELHDNKLTIPFEGGVKNITNDLWSQSVYNVGRYGEYDKEDPHLDLLINTWKYMLKRCYDTSSKSYLFSGAKGDHVDKHWLTFANFQKDAKELPNWNLKIAMPSQYHLNKDILFASNRYSKKTCCWANKLERNYNRPTNRPFVGISPDGRKVLFRSFLEAKRKYNLNKSDICKCLNNESKSCHGWHNFHYLHLNGLVLRTKIIDQLANVIASIKQDPNSRRHVISLWSARDLNEMRLPCCHGTVIQFYVRDRYIDIQTYQRSADFFLGVPINIASYSFLLYMICEISGYKPGMLIYHFGDAHLYLNHLRQAKQQIRNAQKILYDFPVLKFARKIKDINDFKYEDFIIENYQSWPKIKAEVSV